MDVVENFLELEFETNGGVEIESIHKKMRNNPR